VTCLHATINCPLIIINDVTQVKLEPGYFAIAMALKVVEGVSLALNKDVSMVIELTD